jgi:hypothetical protein
MKKLVVILVVVVAAFLGLLYYGNSRRDDTNSARPEWISNLDSLRRDIPITGADFFPPSDSFVIPQSRSAQYRIRNSSTSKLRTLKLELLTPGEARVDLHTLGATEMRIGMPLKSAGPKTTSKLQIPQDGAEITITCKASLLMQVCRLRLTQ